ncbi:hypothetical protein [Pseudophaeobacter flagellatus]|uniref:hypothetical protein n=1 Tax=Pseudophaeobacter flagellatus TaxID=2899119 RepID=UPI001E5583EA|nr:hypothetical protein [Pseudophaeobacter flagellatus]
MATIAGRNAERNFAAGGNKLVQLYEEGASSFQEYPSPLSGANGSIETPSKIAKTLSLGKVVGFLHQSFNRNLHKKQDILEKGQFLAYVLPPRINLKEVHPNEGTFG